MSSDSDSTFNIPTSNNLETAEVSIANDQDHDSDTNLQDSSSSSASSSSSSESAPEIWEESSSSETENNTEKPVQSHLHFMTSVFIAFFQLCFNISDRAISILLTFFSSLFQVLSSTSETLKSFSENFPKTLYSLRKNLKSVKSFSKYVVCPSCHRLYQESECIVKECGVESSLKCRHVKFPNHPHQQRRKECGKDLMKKVKINNKYKLIPRKIYVYYSIIESIQRLICLPGFLELCEEWRGRNVPAGWLSDVYDGKLWKDWMQIEDVPFLSVPGNLMLMLNLDWFQPYKHSPYSVGVIYLVIQNLPRRLRFKPENIIIVATIPGPREPSCDDLNPYLDCMVDDLLVLFKGVSMKTPSSHLQTRYIRAALVYVSCDLPATRKVCGFYGIKAKQGCSKCLKKFPSTTFGNTNYAGFNREAWESRDLSTHLAQVQRAKKATSQAAREKVEREIGVRYSELLRLKYFDVVRYHAIDPMHNLFLGTSKHMLKLWRESGILLDHEFQNIQDQVDNINPPSGIGRLPHKILSQFSGFTAEQWMLWTTLYSPLVLRGILPEEHYAHWCLFSQACSYLCSMHINEADVIKADELLLTFCKRFQELYGEAECTPNMHMHCHLKECILDVGPFHSFWCFSFERYNGILENMKKSWKAPEVQLIHKFNDLQTLASIELPATIPKELQQCFMQTRKARIALPDIVINSLSVLKYEDNMLCSVQQVCAAKLDFQQLIPPGKEKLFSEDSRDLLREMYDAIYGKEKVLQVPLHYQEYREIKIFDRTYSSCKSRTSRSAAIIAVWPSLSGILKRAPIKDDIRVGVIQSFILHTPSLANEEKNWHVLAQVSWLDDHPHKFALNNGIILSSTLPQPANSSMFMPVSRIISQCATVNRTLQMTFGEDHVCIALPLKRHPITTSI